MIAALSSIANSITNFFTGIWNWTSTGIHDAIVYGYAAYIEHYTLATIKFKLYIINFAWDIAKQILIDLQFNQKMIEFFSFIPDYIQVNLMALRIPEGITLIATALVTKYVLRFIPGGH